MKLGLVLSLAIFVGGPACAGEIDKLSWLAGSWAGTNDGVVNEEHWSAPRAGTMVGMHRDVRSGRTVGFEFFRIVEDSTGSLVYLSQPGGESPPTPFRAKTVETKRVVFENPEHDFPQRVLYWIEKGALRARIEGTMNGKEDSVEWTWKPAKLR